MTTENMRREKIKIDNKTWRVDMIYQHKGRMPSGFYRFTGYTLEHLILIYDEYSEISGVKKRNMVCASLEEADRIINKHIFMEAL